MLFYFYACKKGRFCTCVDLNPKLSAQIHPEKPTYSGSMQCGTNPTEARLTGWTGPMTGEGRFFCGYICICIDIWFYGFQY